jgi:pyruvate formate lyase activating enzyme
MKVAEEVPLEGASPFELRVELSKSVSESVVKKALETGDLGFLHSFTTGSAVDGPGSIAVFTVTTLTPGT